MEVFEGVLFMEPVFPGLAVPWERPIGRQRARKATVQRSQRKRKRQQTAHDGIMFHSRRRFLISEPKVSKDEYAVGSKGADDELVVVRSAGNASAADQRLVTRRILAGLQTLRSGRAGKSVS